MCMMDTGNRISKHLLEPSFDERWLRFYSGTFILDGTGLTSDRMVTDVYHFYETVRAHRTWKWPRPIAKYLLVPIYCADSFDHPLPGGYFPLDRWCVLVKPVLYFPLNNSILGKEAPQNWNSGYYEYMNALFAAGVSKVAKHFGHSPETTSVTEILWDAFNLGAAKTCRKHDISEETLQRYRLQWAQR